MTDQAAGSGAPGDAAVGSGVAAAVALGPRLAELAAAGGLDSALLWAIAQRALAEDLGPHGRDVTTLACLRGDPRGTGEIIARQPGVVAGTAAACAVFEACGLAEWEVVLPDSASVAPGQCVVRVEGALRGMLAAERSALNLLCHLSGVATLTAEWVRALAGTPARLLDTRKTTPGLRALEKAAVRAGGGGNKRMGLFDAALVKDNHVLAAGGLAPAYRAVRDAWPGVEVQVECDTLAQVQEALDAGADFLLCDNFEIAQLAEAVRLARGRARVEATGGLTLDRAAQVGATGVDFLSVGALTHSAPALDLGLDLRTDPRSSGVRGPA